jgi:hypothetical protein
LHDGVGVDLLEITLKVTYLAVFLSHLLPQLLCFLK